jgi:protoporphyrinogen oxidase
MSHTELTDKVVAKLTQIRWLSQSDIVDACVTDLKYAYPILEVNGEQRVKTAVSWLGQFKNVSLAGRNGLFAYAHLHDMIKNGADIIDSIMDDTGVRRS